MYYTYSILIKVILSIILNVTGQACFTSQVDNVNLSRCVSLFTGYYSSICKINNIPTSYTSSVVHSHLWKATISDLEWCSVSKVAVIRLTADLLAPPWDETLQHLRLLNPCSLQARDGHSYGRVHQGCNLCIRRLRCIWCIADCPRETEVIN